MPSTTSRARSSTTTDRLTIAALCGNAGAGGVFLALAADRVWMHNGVVLNPHYKGMGNLYGSEYWTYLLPRRVGEARAREITSRRLPMSARGAVECGLADAHFGHAAPGVPARVDPSVRRPWPKDPAWPVLLEAEPRNARRTRPRNRWSAIAKRNSRT